MKESISSKILKQKEEKFSIKIPSSLFDEISLKQLDQKLETGNLYPVSKFYLDYPKFLNEKAFIKMENLLESPRRLLSTKDIEIIKNICDDNKEDEGILLSLSGNLMYLEEVIRDLERQKNLQKTIKVSVMLYFFLSLIELLSTYLSKLIKNRIYASNEEKSYKDFLKSFEEGSHPTIGKLVNALQKMFHFSDSFMNETIFKDSRLIRNTIAHANLFYDSKKDLIYQSNSKEYTFEKFSQELEYLFQFTSEVLFRMNDCSTKLLENIKLDFERMGRFFFRCSRAGLNPQFREIVSQMSKD